jgi:hypothetical protein
VALLAPSSVPRVATLSLPPHPFLMRRLIEIASIGAGSSPRTNHAFAAMPFARPRPPWHAPEPVLRRAVAQHSRRDRDSERSALSARTARFHPARASLHAVLPVWEGSTIIHDFVACGTIATPSPVRPGWRYRLCDQTTLASGSSRHREHPVAPNHATGASYPFSPPVMERWIV